MAALWVGHILRHGAVLNLNANSYFVDMSCLTGNERMSALASAEGGGVQG